MNINITGRKIDITQPLRQHAVDKIKKVLKYTDKIIDVHIIMSMERYLYTVEITLTFKGHRIFAKESSADMYSSVDLAMEKVIKQLRRYRDRIKSHKVGNKNREEL